MRDRARQWARWTQSTSRWMKAAPHRLAPIDQGIWRNSTCVQPTIAIRMSITQPLRGVHIWTDETNSLNDIYTNTYVEQSDQNPPIFHVKMKIENIYSYMRIMFGLLKCGCRIGWVNYDSTPASLVRSIYSLNSIGSVNRAHVRCSSFSKSTFLEFSTTARFVESHGAIRRRRKRRVEKSDDAYTATANSRDARDPSTQNNGKKQTNKTERRRTPRYSSRREALTSSSIV